MNTICTIGNTITYKAKYRNTTKPYTWIISNKYRYLTGKYVLLSVGTEPIRIMIVTKKTIEVQFKKNRR